MERRLAAILAADVVGYSRLIRADEEGTLGRLKSLCADLIDPAHRLRRRGPEIGHRQDRPQADRSAHG